MDRSAAVKLWRDISLGMPEVCSRGRILELFATAVETAERERISVAEDAALSSHRAAIDASWHANEPLLGFDLTVEQVGRQFSRTAPLRHFVNYVVKTTEQARRDASARMVNRDDTESAAPAPIHSNNHTVKTEFEAWLASLGRTFVRRTASNWFGGAETAPAYVASWTEAQWEGWRARAALAQNPGAKKKQACIWPNCTCPRNRCDCL